jgi:MFS transporter, FSR family, fosmidomycin resistance protein
MVHARPPLSCISANLLVFGTAHAAIDCVCAALVLSLDKNQGAVAGLVLLYNVLAFSLQPVFGLAVDYWRSPYTSALLGCAFVGLATACLGSSPAALVVVLAGLGNALYHVGGGSISLNLTPRRAAAPGIYVAPGAVGLLGGTLLVKSGLFLAWPAILIITGLALLMVVTPRPPLDYERGRNELGNPNAFMLVLLLVLLAIAIRSAVGLLLVFPWKTDVSMLLLLTLAVALGKGLGGILGDMFGWRPVAIGALLGSLPLLVFGAGDPVLAICGMFLFNMTMPITLAAVANLLPGRPGFAFGLTCLALLLGALPVFYPFKQFLANNWFLFGALVVAVLALYYGLKADPQCGQESKTGLPYLSLFHLTTPKLQRWYKERL